MYSYRTWGKFCLESESDSERACATASNSVFLPLHSYTIFPELGVWLLMQIHFSLIAPEMQYSMKFLTPCPMNNKC